MRSCFACLVVLFAATLFAQVPLAPAAQPAAPAIQVPPGAPSVELVENYFKRVFGYETNLQVHVVNILQSSNPGLFDVVTVLVSPEGQQVVHWYVTKDLKNVIAGEMRPFGADPYAKERAELAKNAFGATRGPANAKLLIVEFADLECPACREGQTNMEKLYADYPDARFIFQSYPLSQLHPWAFRAASYLDCISRSNNEQAFAFASAVFSHQREIESIVHRTGDDGKPYVDQNEVIGRMKHYADVAGADTAKIAACAESPETKARVERSYNFGQALGVTSTPTLFVNGRAVDKLSTVPYEALKVLVDFEAQQAAAGK